MASRNTNLAYDHTLSRYEDYVEQSNLREKNIKSAATARPRSSSISASAFILLILAAGAMLAYSITSKAEIAAVHAAIIEQEAVVNALEQENVSMQTRLEQKSSQKVVEDYAENILGMQKLDNAQVEYVSLESGNKVEIAETNTDIFTAIGNFFDDLVEYLMG